jgi:hypothetical protein
MTKTITNYMLRKELKNVVTKNVTGSSTGTGGGQNGENMGDNVTHDINLSMKTFRKIKEGCKEIICNDNTTATLLSSTPFTRWTTNKKAEQGVITLPVDLTACVLTVNKTSVVVGYHPENAGICTDLECLVDMGDNEILFNNTYASLKAKHIIRNGVETE